MIKNKQKAILILIIFATFLVSALFIGKGISVVYGQNTIVGGVVVSKEGYFIADNSVFGGPQCGKCLSEIIERYKCGKKKCSRRVCVLQRKGINGVFTKDSACKAAYGSNVSATAYYTSPKYSTSIDICEYETSALQRVNCILPANPPPPDPPVLDPPCADLKDGVCTKVGTSIFQGGDKDKGNFSTNPSEFIVRVFTIILGFAGGIALLLIIRAGYRLMMSKGKPEGIQQAREQLIAAIIGLVFIIFSFVIFELIFAELLRIPGIGK